MVAAPDGGGMTSSATLLRVVAGWLAVAHHFHASVPFPSFLFSFVYSYSILRSIFFLFLFCGINVWCAGLHRLSLYILFLTHAFIAVGTALAKSPCCIAIHVSISFVVCYHSSLSRLYVAHVLGISTGTGYTTILDSSISVVDVSVWKYQLD